MKMLLKKLSTRWHMYDDELLPAYIVYDLKVLVHKLEYYSSKFPEYDKECVELIKSIVDTIGDAEKFAQRTGCSVRIDGV